jgi:hypothetical protein
VTNLWPRHAALGFIRAVAPTTLKFGKLMLKIASKCESDMRDTRGEEA